MRQQRTANCSQRDYELGHQTQIGWPAWASEEEGKVGPASCWAHQAPPWWWAPAGYKDVYEIAGSACSRKAVYRALAAARFYQGRDGFGSNRVWCIERGDTRAPCASQIAKCVDIHLQSHVPPATCSCHGHKNLSIFVAVTLLSISTLARAQGNVLSSLLE